MIIRINEIILFSNLELYVIGIIMFQSCVFFSRNLFL